MSKILTVGGEIDSAELGVTLVHEHLCFRAPEKYAKEAMNYQVELLRRAADTGIDTIVDMSPCPEVAKVIELGERAPEVNLVLSTGAYLEGSAWSEAVDGLSEDEMVARMTSNLSVGYDGFEDRGVRAGIMKIASREPKLSGWEKKNLRAAAHVQKELRVPIALHSCAGARTQMEYLREHGAEIAATFYSHVEAEFGWEGRSREEEAHYLEDVARAGGYLQFNNFGFEFDTPFEDMLYLINRLEEDGYGDRILLSLDANWEFDEDGRAWHEAEREHPETAKRTYAYVVTRAVPMLMGAGVSLQRINRYLVENPRRLFEALEG